MRSLLHRHGDVVLAVGLATVAEIELFLLHLDYERSLFVPIMLLVPLALVWRARYPLAVMALNLVAWVLIDLFTPANEDPLTLAITLAVAVYSVGAHTSGRRAAIGAGLVAAMALLATAVDWNQGSFLDLAGNFTFFAGIFGGTWLAGRAIRRRRGRERDLILEREEKARVAVLEERTRIARELHDVVAHAISVIVLQARGARHTLTAEPDDARAAIDAIERTATQALREMRRLLGMLRADNDELALAPQPSLAHLDTLVAHVRDAGLPVDVRVEGRPRELSPGVDLSAYRIVQEALTNALKHAAGARARVLVRYGDAFSSSRSRTRAPVVQTVAAPGTASPACASGLPSSAASWRAARTPKAATRFAPDFRCDTRPAGGRLPARPRLPRGMYTVTTPHRRVGIGLTPRVVRVPQGRVARVDFHLDTGIQ